MRPVGIIALLPLLAACAGSTPPPAARPASAVPAQEALPSGTVVRPDRTQRDDVTPRQTGEPRYAPFDIGGGGQAPVIPDQVSPIFRDF